MQTCPCGSQKVFTLCCDPYMSGVVAPTAEALMRSRYTAYALGNMDYIAASMCGKAAQGFNLEAAKASVAGTDWERLQIVDVVQPALVNEYATVEFKAYYKSRGVPGVLHEKSYFQKVDGCWFYIDGTVLIAKKSPKISRNAPCPCGSGKKYKKCCNGSGS